MGQRDGVKIQLLIIFQENEFNMIVLNEKSGTFKASYPMQC